MAINEVTISNLGSPGDAVVLKPARRVMPTLNEDRFSRSITGALYERDLNYDSVETLEVEFYLTSLSQSDLNQLMDWNETKQRLTVSDGAVTSPENVTLDAYYKTYSGFITSMPPDFASPNKMTGSPVVMRFIIDTVTTVSV